MSQPGIVRAAAKMLLIAAVCLPVILAAELFLPLSWLKAATDTTEVVRWGSLVGFAAVLYFAALRVLRLSPKPVSARSSGSIVARSHASVTTSR